MFMTAPEIKSRVTESPDRGEVGDWVNGEPTETMDQMWDRKWKQAQYPEDSHYDPAGAGLSLADSIRQRGFTQVHNRFSRVDQKGRTHRWGGSEAVPLTSGGDETQLLDSHHRVEVMSRLHPHQFMNVSHAIRGEGETAQWSRSHSDAVMAAHEQYPRPRDQWHDVRLGSMR